MRQSLFLIFLFISFLVNAQEKEDPKKFSLALNIGFLGGFSYDIQPIVGYDGGIIINYSRHNLFIQRHAIASTFIKEKSNQVESLSQYSIEYGFRVINKATFYLTIATGISNG